MTAVAAVLVVVAGLVYLNRPAASSEPFAAHVRPEVSGRVAGVPDAPVKIVAFEDFQCPFCARFNRDTEPVLLREYVEPGIASIEFVPYSFLGPESRQAAEAAECAADQGRFWEYHDLLFFRQGRENSGVYSPANLKRYARQLTEHVSGFDVGAFDRCLDSGRMRVAVEQHNQHALGAGVSSTPTFTINGAVLRGAQPIAAFREAIEAARTSRP